MADKDNTEVQSVTKAKAADSPSDDSYPVEQLIGSARAFLGVESYVAAGALFGVDDKITVADAKSRIDKFLTTPVQEA